MLTILVYVGLVNDLLLRTAETWKPYRDFLYFKFGLYNRPSKTVKKREKEIVCCR